MAALTASASSRSVSADLRHPIPDLQTLQGAYVKNVERLEQSAEELSQGGSDIGEEIRKLKIEQDRLSRRTSFASHDGQRLSISIAFGSNPSRNASTGSYPNSIVDVNNAARWGGYSPGGFISSPQLSRVSSLQRPIAMAEIVQEDRPMASASFSSFAPSRKPSVQSLAPTHEEGEYAMSHRPSMVEEQEEWDQMQSGHDRSHRGRQTRSSSIYTQSINETAYRPATPPDRPPTTDTCRQARSLFRDFDGVHFSPITDEFVELDASGNEVNRVSSREFQQRIVSRQLAHQSRPVSYLIQPPGENMVFYPAPVPRMLNLPKKLSQLPAATVQARRRSEMPAAMAMEAADSAPFLPMLEFENTRSEQGESQTTPSVAQEEQFSAQFPVQPVQRQSMLYPRISRMNLAKMPAQLRASVFFDQQSVAENIHVGSGSAVATLDSILAASVNAPVNVFTDHPFAGSVGKDYYAREQPARRSTTTMIDLAKTARKAETEGAGNQRRAVSSGSPLKSMPMLKNRRSVMSMFTDIGNPGGKKLRKRSSKLSLATNFGLVRHEEGIEGAYEDEGSDQGSETEDHYSAQDESDEEEQVSEPEDDYEEQQFDERYPVYAQPTTLLAELQLRKAQQKTRNRTAATSYPNGMHSTLLQLDAVAQIEQAKRQGKRTRLAWEDPDLQAQDDERADEDENVPLAVLYPEKNGLVNRGLVSDWDRPLGLIERRQLEDNEPLSRRRNRLLGVDPERALREQALRQRQEDMAEAQAAASLLEQEEQEADEPLAQRVQRLKEKKALDEVLGEVSNDKSAFADELLSRLDIKSDAETPETATKAVEEQSANAAVVAQGEDEEETLGQRRARLQREREAAQPSTVTPTSRPVTSTSSMANLLAANPVSAAATIRSNHALAPGSLLATNANFEERGRQQLRSQNARSVSYGNGMAPKQTAANAYAPGAMSYYPPQQSYAQMPVYPQQMHAGMGMGMGMPYGNVINPLAYQQFVAPVQYPAYGMPAQNWQMAMPGAQMGMMGYEQVVDPRYQGQLDRWRLSVAQ